MTRSIWSMVISFLARAAATSGLLAPLRQPTRRIPRPSQGKMRELRVNDAYNEEVEVRQDGRVLHGMYLMKVKAPAESKKPYDYYQVLARIPGEAAFRPLSKRMPANEEGLGRTTRQRASAANPGSHNAKKMDVGAAPEGSRPQTSHPSCNSISYAHLLSDEIIATGGALI